MTINIVIFASGNGTNAENIVRHFAGSDTVKVAAMFTGNPRAGVIERMSRYGVPCRIFSREQWNDPTDIVNELHRLETRLIVLAGFLSVVKKEIIDAVGGNIINIHPSLLPRHGGKGMWGMHVHRAVLEAGDTESGITIHYVTEEIDGGAILCQRRCPVMPGDTPESLAQRVHQLEYEALPGVIATLADTMQAS